jgi:hypothetical protein
MSKEDKKLIEMIGKKYSHRDLEDLYLIIGKLEEMNDFHLEC